MELVLLMYIMATTILAIDSLANCKDAETKFIRLGFCVFVFLVFLFVTNFLG